MTGSVDRHADRAILDVFAAMARELGAEQAEALPPDTGWFGLFVRTLPDGQEVWLVRMGCNWRILETHRRSPCYGRYWCYPGRGTDTFVVALRHALSYGDGEPDGWIKAWGPIRR